MKHAYILASNLRFFLVIEGDTLAQRTHVIGGTYPFASIAPNAVLLPARQKATAYIRKLLLDPAAGLDPATPTTLVSANDVNEFWWRLQSHLDFLTGAEKDALLEKVAVIAKGVAPRMAAYVAEEQAAKKRAAAMLRQRNVDAFLASL